jgi:TnpA family transposase
VRHLQNLLSRAARAVDRSYPGNEHWYFNKKGKPVLRRGKGRKMTPEAKRLRRELLRRMPQRSLLDILSNAQHWVNFARHFGPASGTEPHRHKTKLRYILTTFCYGCNLGPTQTAHHLNIATRISPRILAFINQQHISSELLNDAINDIINHYTRFELPYFWGSGKTVAADGTEIDLSRNNLLAERHVRYGRYGGIAYHHVSDMYVALFSHFIACGVWEAVYIIDGLLKNKSDVQPDTIHADSQGQAEPVFGLSFMLGIDLMPRIRHWSDLKMYRPFANTHYKHIDALFSDVINWEVIERHWKELMQVVISIHAGKVLPSMLLRKLGSYSRKNSLYHAFQELGRVIRTIFLLNYISNLPLRQYITATTNKVESYNGFLKWLFFGGLGVISHDDPIEYEKRVKYTDLIANAIMLQNVVDMTRILRQLAREGYGVTRETLSFLSPYLTEHIRRFGDYVIDLDRVPPPLELDAPLLDLVT